MTPEDLGYLILLFPVVFLTTWVVLRVLWFLAAGLFNLFRILLFAGAKGLNELDEWSRT